MVQVQNQPLSGHAQTFGHPGAAGALSPVDRIIALDAEQSSGMQAARTKRQMQRWGIRIGASVALLVVLGLGYLAHQFLQVPLVFAVVPTVVIAIAAQVVVRFLPDIPKPFSQREVCVALVPRLRLAPGGNLALGLATYDKPMHLTVTLASGAEATLERWTHTFSTSSVSGRRRTTTTTRTATDVITLRFAPGRFPHLSAVVAALRQAGGAGSRVEVEASDSHVTWRTPVQFVGPNPMSPANSLPPKLASLHGLLDPTPVAA